MENNGKKPAMTGELIQGRRYVTATGYGVKILARGGNYATGEFEKSGNIEFWHLDGTHDTDPMLNLAPARFPFGMKAVALRLAGFAGTAMAGILIGAAVFYFNNRPPH